MVDQSLPLDLDDPVSLRGTHVPLTYTTAPYPYSRADGAAVAHPLFQAGDGGSTPTSALHLRFTPIGFHAARALNALWHSVLPNMDARCCGGGPIPAQCYVAEFGGHYFGVAIWTAPTNRELGKQGDRILELRRLALAPPAPKNTASRMLSYMTRDLRRRFPTIEQFISYQATEHHSGTIYRAAGWSPVHHTTYIPWGAQRPRGAAQTTSDKIRWSLVTPCISNPPENGSEVQQYDGCEGG